MTKFADLKLDPKVLKAITEAGYDTPTPIQAGAIPPALEGRDVLGIAQTGTGKTASFTLPMITLLGRGRARARMPRSLVLAPTRELAAQVAENFDIYAKHTKLTKALLIGGVSFGEQDKLIDRGVDVLIATPGRLLDHFERGKLLLTGVQIMVVDEADRMLDMGFIPDIERIFQLTPFTRQTLFFSATMAPEIERITDTFLHSPERIEVARQATTSETITQRLVELTPTRKDQTAKQKRELLRALIDAEGDKLQNAIIFCNRKTDVDIVSKSLHAHGYNASPIHGDLDQSQRMRTLDDFRDGRLRFLIASDVAARGLDIPTVSHVFNFDLPSHAEDYVHRIGRTGRAGREGTAISIATPMDEKFLTAIEGLVKQSLPRVAVPENFQLSAASQNAPRPHNGRDGGRGRSDRGRRSDRRHSRDNGHASQAEVAEVAAPTPEAAPVAAAEPVRDHRRHDDRREDRRDQPQDRNQDRGQDRGQDRSQDRGRGDRRDDNHRYRDRRDDRHQVVGMGDHVPDFMLRSFRTSIALSEAQDAAPASDVTVVEIKTAPAPQAPQVAETTEASAQPAPKPHSRRTRKPKAPPATEATAPETVAVTETVETTPVSETPVSEAAAPEASAPEAVAETPKPVRKRAPRKPKAAPAADAAAPIGEQVDAAPEVPADKPKPVRKRAPRKPKVTDTPSEPTTKA